MDTSDLTADCPSGSRERHEEPHYCFNHECAYLIPLRHGNAHYETRIHPGDRFLYHKRLIPEKKGDRR